MRWALISSEKGHKRADLTLAIAERLRAGGARVAGFVQLRCRDSHDQKSFEMMRLTTGERAQLAAEGVGAKGPTQEGFCTYAFDNSAFERAFAWLQADAPNADVLVLDDVSKLETQGKGHAASLAWALEQPGKTVLISVRASQLFYVMENFGLLVDDPIAAIEMPAGERACEELVAAILAR